MTVLNTDLKKLISVFIFLLFTLVVSGQIITKGTVQRVKVHGKSLERNLIGDPADRNVSIYLPASYKASPKKRYPVVYCLHGFTDDDAQWYGLKKHWINLPAILDSAYSKGNLKEAIFVTPDAFTKFSGSFYSNSVTTGNWEEFIATELVAYIDAHYRTIPKASARGLTGHSMGGHGTLRIGQEYPNIFSSIYLLSPAVLAPIKKFISKEKFESIKTFEDLQKSDFETRAAYSLSAAWSPNPNNAPFFIDYPVSGSEQEQYVRNKWTANSPLAALDRNIDKLKKLKGIAFDAGDRDEEIVAGITLLDLELTKYKIKHSFEIYPGDHINGIGVRIRDKVLPFFSENLVVK